jgi:hypothetical protein
MALALSVENGTLVFTSAGYFIDFGRLRFRMPRWLAPGQTVVTHRETAGDEFLFTFDLAPRGSERSSIRKLSTRRCKRAPGA